MHQTYTENLDFFFLKSQTLHVFNVERDLSYPVPSVFLWLTLELVIQGDNRLLQHRDIGKLSFHEKKLTAMPPPQKKTRQVQTDLFLSSDPLLV